MASTDLHLTAEERAMLAGEAGPGAQKAIEIVVALGRIYGAADLVPVASVQVSGVSYKNLGDAGLEFLQAWAAQGAQARVPATLNPAGMDLAAWAELGFSPEFARRQQAVVAAYEALGVLPTCTCAPYLIGHEPAFGQHIAWAESSAVSFANSVLGARTNREGGPSALAAAVAGRTARYGFHLDAHRQPTLLVDVRCPVRSEADLGALGYLVGRHARTGVPYFRALDPTGWSRPLGFSGPLQALSTDVSAEPDQALSPVQETPKVYAHVADGLRTLGAAMAAAGAVALYHVEGLTPEARSGAVTPPAVEPFIVDDLAPGYAALNGPATEIDLVSLGCPHASLAEIETMATYLDGRRVRAALWITTARAIRDAAAGAGLVARIEAAGGRVVADTCMVVAPVADLGFRSLATNSAKMAFYTPSHSGLTVRFGAMAECLDAALTGQWRGAGSR
ncbi:MAG TPA: aconitase X catalytic domain-containing protein [Anaerolineae bacterium]|nr:aconitase X catalytic domain-containing protein [Anaerolineae bacterium]